MNKRYTETFHDGQITGTAAVTAVAAAAAAIKPGGSEDSNTNELWLCTIILNQVDKSDNKSPFCFFKSVRNGHDYFVKCFFSFCVTFHCF